MLSTSVDSPPLVAVTTHQTCLCSSAALNVWLTPSPMGIPARTQRNANDSSPPVQLPAPHPSRSPISARPTISGARLLTGLVAAAIPAAGPASTAATAASASSIRRTRESARSDGLCGWVREESIYVEGLIEASVGPSSCQEECEYSDDFDRRAHVDDLPQARHRCIAQADAAV